MLLFAFCLYGCSDPCRELAESICKCESTQVKRNACREQLNLSEGHVNFELARDTEACVLAKKQCSCEKIEKGQDELCGQFRH